MKNSAAQAIAAAIAASLRERMLHKVSTNAALYEARWTMGALLRADSDLHEALEEQIAWFHEALVTGSDNEITMHGEATCRGWAAAIIAMEKSGTADDAYHIGEFGETRVMIGRQQHMPPHLREQYGDEMVWLTPREIAALYTKLELARALKAVWPDGEIVNIRNKDTK